MQFRNCPLSTIIIYQLYIRHCYWITVCIVTLWERTEDMFIQFPNMHMIMEVHASIDASIHASIYASIHASIHACQQAQRKASAENFLASIERANSLAPCQQGGEVLLKRYCINKTDVLLPYSDTGHSKTALFLLKPGGNYYQLY